MKNLLFIFITIVTTAFVVGTLSSCSEDDCSLAGRAMINGTFYTTNAETDAIIKDTIPTLTVTALGTDSIIINSEKDVKTVSLPLSYVSDVTVLVFHYDYATNPADADTISIRQENTLFFESIECGYTMEQSIIDITHTENLLSSITINNKNANVNGTENLTFNFKPRN